MRSIKEGLRCQVSGLRKISQGPNAKCDSPERATMIFFKDDSLACPYFVPREIVNDGSWPHPSRLPLGAGWKGECCGSEQIVSPDDFQIREFCNLGYATRCPHLPPQRDWDAIRFAVARTSDDQIIIAYSCERAHAPKEHGAMTFDLRREVWTDPHADERVRRLAEAFLGTYRSRIAAALIE